MRRHAKASSSGSSTRQANRLVLALLAAAVLAGAVFLGAVQALASAPTVTTGSATAITDVSATLHGSLDPTGVETTDCHFEWGTDTSYGNSAPCAQGNAFTEPSEVSAELSGLTMATTYHYRLVVTNGEGESQGEDRSFATAGPPTVSRTFVSEVSARAATLNAELDPEGGATSYHFEYVEDAAFQASGFSSATSAPVPDAALEAGTAPLTVSQRLTGLTPGTYYHYRLVASNGFGPLSGPERIFRTDPLPSLTQPGQFPGQGFLPDNRVWEMVSPPEKNGGGLRAGSPRTVVSPDGLRVSYAASAAFGDVQGTGALGDVQYVASRGSGGWTSHSITPDSAPEWTQTIFGITRALPSESLSHAVVQAYDLPGASGDVPEGISNLYRVDADGANLTTVTSPADPAATNPAFDLFLGESRPIGGDSDFNRIYFSSAQPLLPEAAFFTRNVYEWDEGTLSLAGVLPDGSLPPAGSREVVQPQKGDLSANLNSVSTDGSKALFLAAAPSGVNDQLYMRRDRTDTVWVSESEGSTPVPDPQGVTFGWATPDLHRVAFTTESQLNDEDPGGPGNALYVYTDSPDPEGEDNLEFIYRGGERVTVAGMGVAGSAGFFDDGVKLYHWDEGGVQVAIDADADGENPQLGDMLESLHSSESLVRVSADGTRIAFLHENTQLTESELGSPGSFYYRALYVYDSDTEMLACASCPPSGAATTGATWLWPEAGEDVGLRYNIEGARFLSADGRFAFFSSPDALVPEDVNGRYDAYEYDIDTGEPHLLSSGHSSLNSWFAGTSASGDDAFFITQEALSGHDVDNAKDMYDARVGGGLPEPLPAPPACEGDACQPAAVGLNDPTPASSSFVGAGNQKARRGRKARRCPRGKHRVKARSGKARCVKKRAHRKRGGAR